MTDAALSDSELVEYVAAHAEQLRPSVYRKAIECAEVLLRERAERSLHEFVKVAWHILEPGRAFIDGMHVAAICEHLEAVERGEIRRLVINVPFGSSKSSIVSTLYPAWVWTRRPSIRWLCVSHSEKLAVRDTRHMRLIVQSEWFQSRWPLGFARDENLKSSFMNDAMGHRVCCGMLSGATGLHADRLVIDDPHDMGDAYSAQALQRAIEEYREKLSTRLNNQESDPVIAIGQRLAEGDLLGYLIGELGFKRLVIPMRFERAHPIKSNTGWRDPRTEEGELMCPERFSDAAVREQERVLGARGVAGQYQQRPSPAGGEQFRREHFRYFSSAMVQQQDGTERESLALTDGEGRVRHVWRDECFGFQTADTAQKVKQENDWTVVLTALVTPDPPCLLVYDVARVKLTVPQQYGFLCQQRARFPWVEMVAVEDKASGIGLIQEGAMRGQPLVKLKAEVDKLRRAVTVLTWYEAGLVYHRADGVWREIFEAELLSFPMGQNDDQEDALAYAGIIAQNRQLYGLSSGAMLSYRTEEQQAAVDRQQHDGRRAVDRMAARMGGGQDWGRGEWAFGGR